MESLNEQSLLTKRSSELNVRVMVNGVINLDKPAGLTSARAVDRVKRLLPKGTKIGHAGTLDPFATGVLLLLIGKATKKCELLMGEPKTYEAMVKLGASSTTDDIEGEITPREGAHEVTRERVADAIGQFIGEIQQRPPAFSAMKIAGQRAYKLAREGKSVELEARTVKIYSIDILRYDWPELQLRIECGRGTYIRSIARDLGEAIGAGGYLTALRRTRIGRFDIADAVTIERLQHDGIERFVVEIDS